MKIEESSVRLSSSHEYQSTSLTKVSSSLSFRQVYASVQADDADKAEEERQRVAQLLKSLVDALLAAMKGWAGKPCATTADLAGEGEDCAESAPKLQQMASWHTETTVSYSESESTSVCGSGQVRTADGRCIDFDFGLDMQRSWSTTLHSESSGEMLLKDPLVLNFSGSAAELTGQRIDFDLDADGQVEQIPGLGAGNGYLVFDRNANGRADDGSELFGAMSGDGFADLAKLDSDGNGWVDEGDAAFKQLLVWDGADGYAGLAEQGVGALYTRGVAAPFALKDENNGLLGQIRAVGVYLNESGTVGSLQQLDLAVSAPAEEQPQVSQALAA